MIPLSHYLVVSALLFAIGTAGVFLRKNLITILLSIEYVREQLIAAADVEWLDSEAEGGQGLR